MSWLDLLRAEVQSSSMARAAARLGISRTAVSLCLSDKYGAKTDRIEQRVWDVLGQVDCPFANEHISATTCRQHRERAAPLNNPMAMRLWRTCQHCPHNPNAVEASHERIH